MPVLVTSDPAGGVSLLDVLEGDVKQVLERERDLYWGRPAGERDKRHLRFIDPAALGKWQLPRMSILH